MGVEWMTLSVRIYTVYIYLYLHKCFLTYNSTNSWCERSLCWYRVSLVNYWLTVLVLDLKRLMLPEVLLQCYGMWADDQNRLDPMDTKQIRPRQSEGSLRQILSPRLAQIRQIVTWTHSVRESAGGVNWAIMSLAPCRPWRSCVFNLTTSGAFYQWCTRRNVGLHWPQGFSPRPPGQGVLRDQFSR